MEALSAGPLAIIKCKRCGGVKKDFYFSQFWMIGSPGST